MATVAPDTGPWHGQFEGHARVYMVLALLEAAALVISPWLLGWIAILHHPGRIYASDLPVSPGWLALIDLLGIILAYAWFSLYRRLGTKIAEGAPGYPFLDRIRLTMSLLAQNVLALVILIAIKVR
ncbi:MAG TPA: hypothetical protein VHZ25_15140 [Acidobacteriaceae bacterium]|jgi:hypothetical protein|nr:hypothetical protein [Acidobacteriaceae bacterium]